MPQISNYYSLLSRKIHGLNDLFDQKIGLIRQGNDGKKVLLNSFPKSGTHLLDQILAAYPQLRSYNRFATHASSFVFREKSMEEITNVFNKSISNELVKGHLRYSSDLEDALDKNNFLTFFLFRDPRDVVASEAHYLRSMNPWHKLHKYFSQTTSIQEAINISINGLDNSVITGYPNFRMRFSPFLGWLEMENCVCLRFEDFFGDKSDVIEPLIRISEKLDAHFGSQVDSEFIALKLFNAIDPSSSHTFRAGGGRGKWREVFTEDQEELFNAMCHEILERLGY